MYPDHLIPSSSYPNNNNTPTTTTTTTTTNQDNNNNNINTMDINDDGSAENDEMNSNRNRNQMVGISTMSAMTTPLIPLHVNRNNLTYQNKIIGQGQGQGSHPPLSPPPVVGVPGTGTGTISQPQPILNSNNEMNNNNSANAIEIIMEGKRVIREFLQNNKCHELIKNSSKVVVFDISIPVNLAFFALVEHDIKAAPLWNSTIGRFVGTITETDFLVILKQLYCNGSTSISDLSEYSLASWQTMNPSYQEHYLPLMSGEQHMVSISPESTLYDACVLLNKYGVHRLPILDIEQNSVLTIITRSSILDYLVSCFREDRRLFDQSIYDLNIGTYKNVITVTETTPLIQVLELLAVHKVGAIPITDANGVVINILCVSDITELAKERYGMSQLELPVIELLRMQYQDGVVSGGGDGISGLFCCSKSDTLHTLFEIFAATKTRRLVCLDQDNRCVGLVSLSDLFRYFLV